ncbi:MAG: TIM44-like domain-containing protein [Proteobacteria bacterium]|nr:TIM44-like domain-containing protein [Pseudomonadota bacterium]
MRWPALLLAGLMAAAVALAPMLADARAGSGSSMGSRGSRTWSAPPSTSTAPYGGQPMQRSMTPNAPQPSPGFGAPGSAGASGFAPRSSFASGLLGGLIGAGIGGLLFGHGFMGGGGLGFGGLIGFLLQIFLIVMAVRFLLRLIRGRGAVPAGPAGMFARDGAPPGGGFGGMMPGSAAPGGAMPGAPAGAPLAIGPEDYQAFERLLGAVQAAWTSQDLTTMQRIATPEMVSMFAEQLAEQSSRGVRNSVTDVRLQKGDLAEAWREGSREYATVAMRFSMVDVTVDASGRVVDGNPNEHVTATELWTFMRAVGGGQWLLSAIQQAR